MTHPLGRFPDLHVPAGIEPRRSRRRQMLYVFALGILIGALL